MFKKEKISAKNPLHTKGCKGLAILTVIIILFSFISVPSSAATTDTAFNDLSLKMANVYVLDENDNLVDDVDFAIRSTGATIEGLGKCVTISLSRSSYDIGFTKGDYTLIVQFEADEYLLTEDYYVVGGFSLLCGNQYAINPLLDSSYFYAYRIPLVSNNGIVEEQYGSIKWSVYSNTNRYRIDFSRNELGKIYHKYNVSIPFRINSNETDSIGLFMCDYDLRLVSPSEMAVQEGIEQEKQETQNSGNSAIDDLTSAVPDYSGNIIKSFQKLANQVMHEQTTCQITVPEIKVPKVANYFPDIVLLEQQVIKFEDYLKYIPNTLLFMVRAVLSAAIVLFGCKEVYDIFEYIMTMRGGRNG